MSNEPRDPEAPEQEPEEPEEQEGTGSYNPSGGVPSHPADPGYGGSQGDDTETDKPA